MEKKKVLIVEDDPISELILLNLTETICSNQYTATSGEEAIQLCKQHKDINFILMDIKMKGMDGYTATQEIRKFNKKVIIFAQTAYAQPADREKAIQSGCNEHIAKPIDRNEFYRLVNKYFQ